jgi:hypothetical protein
MLSLRLLNEGRERKHKQRGSASTIAVGNLSKGTLRNLTSSTGFSTIGMTRKPARLKAIPVTTRVQRSSIIRMECRVRRPWRRRTTIHASQQRRNYNHERQSLRQNERQRIISVLGGGKPFEPGVEVKTRTLKTAGMRHQATAT